MRRLPFLLLPLALPATLVGQAGPAPECAADLDAMQTAVRRDYAGFRDKAAARPAALAALTDSVRAEVRRAAGPAACTSALARWAAFFRDPHLQVWMPEPRAASAPAADAAPAADPRLPSLRYEGADAAVLELPDFGDRYKPAIDSLLAAHRERLLATPYLVIDVRRNGGGWTGSYAQVIPLLYTGPIRVHGMEGWASEGNLAYMRQMLDSDRAEGIKRMVRTLLPLMEARRGEFVTFQPDAEVRHDTVYPLPRAVAVLIGPGCVSTCEQFVLDARQSRKVTVMGAANTGGFLDYGNVRRVQLPSGARVMQLPTTRSLRLPAEPLDLVGIAPELRLPGGETDAVALALRHLRGGAR